MVPTPLDTDPDSHSGQAPQSPVIQNPKIGKELKQAIISYVSFPKYFLSHLEFLAFQWLLRTLSPIGVLSAS